MPSAITTIGGGYFLDTYRRQPEIVGLPRQRLCRSRHLGLPDALRRRRHRRRLQHLGRFHRRQSIGWRAAASAAIRANGIWPGRSMPASPTMSTRTSTSSSPTAISITADHRHRRLRGRLQPRLLQVRQPALQRHHAEPALDLLRPAARAAAALLRAAAAGLSAAAHVSRRRRLIASRRRPISRRCAAEADRESARAGTVNGARNVVKILG